jgi:hypothetical protein
LPHELNEHFDGMLLEDDVAALVSQEGYEVFGIVSVKDPVKV